MPISTRLVAVTILSAFFLFTAAGATQAAIVGLREATTDAANISVAPGSTVDLELYLDTEGLSFEGYYLGVDFTGGPVTSLSVAHQSLAGLVADLFGAPAIDNIADTIRDMNQFSFTTPLAPGEYVLDIISIQIDAALGAIILATPGLFGEYLGLDNGACPDAGCSVSFSSVQIQVVPEPGTALLLGGGLMGLALRRSKQDGIPS